MIVVYAPKPLTSRLLAPSFAQKYPLQKIVYIHPFYFSNISFHYPNNTKWKDFPYLSEPLFSIASIEKWKPMHYAGGSLEPIDISMEMVRSSTIIYAGEPDSSEAYLFSVFIKHIFSRYLKNIPHNISNYTHNDTSHHALSHIEALCLLNLDSKSIEHAFFQKNNFQTVFGEAVEKGRIAKYFDYNFNYNSFSLLGRAYRNATLHCRFLRTINHDNHSQTRLHTIQNKDPHISKYMLLLLYFIRQQEIKNIHYIEEKIYSAMSHWRGTGKYHLHCDFAGPASRHTIIENLLSLHLICRFEGYLSLTAIGHSFLNILPKDCMDYDLPFRIQNWSDTSQIDNYLMTYYRKIKNKLKSSAITKR